MHLIQYIYNLIKTILQRVVQIFHSRSNLVTMRDLEQNNFILTKDQVYFKSMSYSTYKYDVSITKRIGSQQNNIYTFKPINNQETSQNLIYLHGCNSLYIDLEFHLSKDLDTINIQDWELHPKLFGMLVSQSGYTIHLIQPPGFGNLNITNFIWNPELWLEDSLKLLNLSTTTPLDIMAVSAGNITLSSAFSQKIFNNYNIRNIYHISNPSTLNQPYVGLGYLVNESSKKRQDTFFFFKNFCFNFQQQYEVSLTKAVLVTLYLFLQNFPNLPQLNNCLKPWVRKLLRIPQISFNKKILICLLSIGFIPTFTTSLDSLRLSSILNNNLINFEEFMNLLIFTTSDQQNIKYYLFHNPNDTNVPFILLDNNGLPSENRTNSNIYNIDYYIKKVNPNNQTFGIFDSLDSNILEELQISDYNNHSLTYLQAFKYIILNSY